MIVIAHYRKTKTWFQLAVGALALAFLLYMTFWSFGGHLISRSMDSPRAVFLIPGLVVAWIFGLMTSFTIAVKAMRLISNEGIAVWWDHGSVNFLRSWYVHVRGDEIAKIAEGRIPTSTFTTTEAVVLHLRNGKPQMFPTSSLVEPRETIIGNLNGALGLGQPE